MMASSFSNSRIFNIVLFTLSITFCNSYVNYNEEEAELFLNLAAAAYPTDWNGTWREQCVQKTFPDDNFKTVKTATAPCDKRQNLCQGFTSVSILSKRIIVSFRGTEGSSQLYQEMANSLHDYSVYNETDRNGTMQQVGKVNKYFLSAMDTMWEAIVEPLLPIYPDYQFLVTGHSLGGAMAALAAFRISFRGLVSDPYRVRVITFGEPREGDYEYAQIFQQYVPYSFRIVHYSDPVPHLPPLNEDNITTDGYPFHHSREIWYNKKFNSYTICNDTFGEDPTCSDSKKFWSYSTGAMTEHLHYFNHFISDYGWHGCNSVSSFNHIVSYFICLLFLFKYSE